MNKMFYVEIENMEKEFERLKSENYKLKEKVKEQSDQLSNQGKIINGMERKNSKDEIVNKLNKIIELIELMEK